MKTVRFSKVIEGSGKPEIHLVLTDPLKDKELQAAVKAERVMTVFQGMAGNKTDRGEVGFNSGTSRQFLAFPKSLKKFKGKSVVGIKYDLIQAPEVQKSERVQAARSPKQGVKKVHEKRAAKKAGAKKRKIAKGKPAEKARKTTPRTKAANIVSFPTPQPSADDESAEVGSLKAQVRRAMNSLEAGKQVEAFNLLKRILEG